jgi:hypothetical protein
MISGMSATQIWFPFGLCLALVGFAGPKLSRSGDIIADKTGLSGNWIGIILLATVTSLPELATGVSAVTAAAAPDIAVGDVLGSCVFNLAILIILDFLQRGESVYRRVRQGQILSGPYTARAASGPGRDDRVVMRPEATLYDPAGLDPVPLKPNIGRHDVPIRRGAGAPCA